MNKPSTQMQWGGGYNFKYPLNFTIIILCSLSLLMMTAGKCKKTGTTSTTTTTYFTVKFDSNGGSAVDSVQVASGSKVSKPADPTRIDYTFAEWYSDAALTQVFDFNTPITKAITLYAKWNANAGKISYNIIFNSNGGNVIVTQQVIAGEKATKPLNPTRQDKYNFAGWYTDVALTQAFDFNAPITGNMTLYAKWVSISFEKNVVGMREFLLNITLKSPSTISFIVTESATAPPWAAVDTNKAKIVRNFTPDKLSRKVYFSATDKYKEVIGNAKLVSLVGQTDVVSYTKVEAPGIMIPGQTYYVHAYQDGKLLNSSEAITLADYPTSYPTPMTKADYQAQNWSPDPFNGGSTSVWSWGSYFWGMNMWAGKLDVEVKPGEIFFLPVRTINPEANNPRPSSYISTIQIGVQVPGISIIDLYINVEPGNSQPVVVSGKDSQGYLFTKTALSLTSNYDILFGVFTGSYFTAGVTVTFLYTADVLPLSGLPSSTSSGWRITAVKE